VVGSQVTKDLNSMPGRRNGELERRGKNDWTRTLTLGFARKDLKKGVNKRSKMYKRELGVGA